MKLQRALPVVLLLLFFSIHSRAQFRDTVVYSLHQKPKFFLTLASFNTFIDGDFASFSGIRTGLSYNKRVRFGIGYFALANNAVITPIEIKGNPVYTTNGELHLRYFCVYSEYLIYQKYPWEVSAVPFQLGFGWAHYEYIQRDPRIRTGTPTEFILLYQPEIGFQYSIVKWLSGGITAGFRFNLYRSLEQSKNLSAPTFALDIRISVDELLKMLFAGSNDSDE
jgi:hypothetical protein